MSEREPHQATSSVKEKNPIFVLNLSFSILNVEYLSCGPHPEIDEGFLNFKPEPRDVVLCSYVKCDNKIIETILWKLLRPNMRMPRLDVITNRYLPTYETVGVKEASQPIGMRPRLLKTHLPYQMVPRYSRTKYIYVVRKPWDVVCSCYRAVKNFTDYDGCFDHFFSRFLDGKLGYGSYFSHVACWHKHIEDENLLVLSDEIIKSEPRSALFTVAAFLGDHYLEHLLKHDDVVMDALRTIDFAHKQDFCSKNDLYGVPAKPCLSREQIKQLAETIENHLKNTGVENLWKSMLKTSMTQSAQREELSLRNQRLSSYI